MHYTLVLLSFAWSGHLHIFWNVKCIFEHVCYVRGISLKLYLGEKKPTTKKQALSAMLSSWVAYQPPRSSSFLISASFLLSPCHAQLLCCARQMGCAGLLCLLQCSCSPIRKYTASAKFNVHHMCNTTRMWKLLCTKQRWTVTKYIYIYFEYTLYFEYYTTVSVLYLYIFSWKSFIF